MWFAISEAGMDPVSRLTNTLLAGGRGRSGVEVGPDQIRVQMGGFKLTVPRASIRSASRSQENVRGTYGVHSRSGRWLVNGSPDGLVKLTIEPPCYTGRKPVSLFTRGKVNALTLAHAGKTAEITVEADTCQITVEPGITITSPRTTSRDIRRHKASNYSPEVPPGVT